MSADSKSSKAEAAFNPQYVSFTTSLANVVGDIALTIDTGLIDQPYFVIDYLTASLSFSGNFVQDPIFYIEFQSQGKNMQHAFLPTRVPCTAAAPSGSQFYVLSERVFFGVDVLSNIVLQTSLMPTGPIVQDAHFTISGHLAAQ